jgi:hypothetical protein
MGFRCQKKSISTKENKTDWKPKGEDLIFVKQNTFFS